MKGWKPTKTKDGRGAWVPSAERKRMNINAKRLAEIKARERNATKGPWYYSEHENRIYQPITGGSRTITYPSSGVLGDGIFIAESRQDIPDLVGALEVAVQALKSLKGYMETTDMPEGNIVSATINTIKRALREIGWEEKSPTNKCKCCGETIAPQVEYCLVCSGEYDGTFASEEKK